MSIVASGKLIIQLLHFIPVDILTTAWYLWCMISFSRPVHRLPLYWSIQYNGKKNNTVKSIVIFKNTFCFKQSVIPPADIFYWSLGVVVVKLVHPEIPVVMLCGQSCNILQILNFKPEEVSKTSRLLSLLSNIVAYCKICCCINNPVVSLNIKYNPTFKTKTNASADNNLCPLDVSNSTVSQPHRGKYIIYVITVSSPRRRLVCRPVSLVVRWQSGRRGLSLLSLSLPPFLFDPGSHRCGPESAPERMKTSSQVNVPPRRSGRPTASRRWSSRRWSPASFLSEGLQLPLDAGDEHKL